MLEEIGAFVGSVAPGRGPAKEFEAERERRLTILQAVTLGPALIELDQLTPNYQRPA